MRQLVAYPWPGNVRELQNVIERAVILSDGDTLLPRHLSLVVGAARTRPRIRGISVDLSGSLAEVTARTIARGGAPEDHAGAARSPATIAAAPRTCCRSTSRRWR